MGSEKSSCKIITCIDMLTVIVVHLIYRCGGSTLTASVAFVNGGMVSIVDNVTGQEGGDNITSILSDYLAEEFQRKFKVDPR